MTRLPRLYAILDSRCFPGRETLLSAAEDLFRAGVLLMQYRNKRSEAATTLNQARELRERLLEANGVTRPRLIMNDRADLCLAAEYDGVHVGQEDLFAEAARKIVGPDRWVGVSTHNPAQVAKADQTSADYIAIGPVFRTFSKANPDPVIGPDGVRQARALTRKPLVAIGGITRQNCLSVMEAGADSVAVISDLLRDPEKSAEEFLRILG
jgi:thiamine-phosphate pyrophosphorylase